MIWRTIIVALCFGLCHSAFGQDAEGLEERHRQIDSVYTAQEYEQVLRLIEQQRKSAQGTTWTDSLYQYIYEYGRSLHKTAGEKQAAEMTEVFVAEVRAVDEDAIHLLDAYIDLSYLYYDLGWLKECYRVDSMSLAFARKEKVPLSRIARQISFLGFDARLLGNSGEAVEWYQEAVDILSMTDPYEGRQAARSTTFNGLAACQWHIGRVAEAKVNYQLALDVLGNDTSIESLALKSSTFNNLALLAEDEGRLTDSRAYYMDGLRLANRILATTSDPYEQDEMIMSRSRTFGNLGALHYAMGQYGISEEYLDAAYAERAKVTSPNDPRLLSIKRQMATLEVAKGNNATADTLLSAFISSAREYYGEYNEWTISGLIDLADVRARSSKREAAHAILDAITDLPVDPELSETDPLRAGVFRKKAELLAEEGRHEEALMASMSAMSIFERLFPEKSPRLHEELLAHAQILSSAGRPAEAVEVVDRVLTVLTNDRTSDSTVAMRLRPKLLPLAIESKVRASRALQTASPELLKDWSEQVDEAIAFLREDQISLRDDESKLIYLGAHNSVYDLGQSLAYESGGQSARVFSLGEENKATLLNSHLRKHIGTLRPVGIPDSLVAKENELHSRMDEAIPATDPEAIRIAEEYDRLLTVLKMDHPAYFEAKYASSFIDPADVISEVLTAEQTLISFSKTDDGLYASVLSKEGVDVLRLDLPELAERIEQHNLSIKTVDDAAYRVSAHELYTDLFLPLEGHIHTTELLIIPDEELFLLNFETLLSSVDGGTTGTETLLIDRYEISYLLSAATALQFERAERQGADKILAMAPGFSDEEKRAYISGLSDSLSIDRQFLRMVQQPFAVSTAERLGAVMSADVLVGMEASEDNFKAKASRYGIIHLGTHTEVNDIAPLYSKLIMSKDDSGNEDGFLHAYEIYELALGAELAVLTACETGTGRSYKAEGMKSLAHSFSYAGCPSVVMSLWQIDEKTSSEIIEDFYDRLLEGEAKNVALRNAKLDFIRSNPDLSSPYYWAGIVLVGDESPVCIDSGVGAWLWAVLALVILVAVILMMLRWSRSRRP